jgi:hypothetical protein
VGHVLTQVAKGVLELVDQLYEVGVHGGKKVLVKGDVCSDDLSKGSVSSRIMILQMGVNKPRVLVQRRR